MRLSQFPLSQATCKLAILLSVKTFQTRTVHFIFSLRIFVSAHLIITSITAPSMFTYLYLVPLLPFADSPVPKFHFQFKKKNREKSWKRLDSTIGQMV